MATPDGFVFKVSTMLYLTPAPESTYSFLTANGALGDGALVLFVKFKIKPNTRSAVPVVPVIAPLV